MNERELKIRQKLKDDFGHYADKCLKIRPKLGSLIPFTLNSAQLYVHKKVEEQKRITGKVRAILLKGRQQGMSTYVGGRFYWLVTHRFGVRAFILTHEKEATNNLFEMTQRYHDNCPQIVRPSTDTSSSTELSFGHLDSGYKVGTAGNKNTGRSSTIQFFHGSEVAAWPNAIDIATGALQCVPDMAGTEIFLESTARGIGNYFHEQWQLAEAGESEFIPIFVPWYWQKEYSSPVPEGFKPTEDEIDLIRLYGLNESQLAWRRKKINEFKMADKDPLRSFEQEYPNTPIDAFSLASEDTFISPKVVLRAQKEQCEGNGKLIVGCDPARFGGDRTSIIYRRGRKAYNLQSFNGKDTMQVANMLHQIIITDHPDYVCVDVGGLGAGVVDRLIELGHDEKVIAVNFGSSAFDEKKYSNKRAEMWGLTNEWLTTMPVEIPDSKSLAADLCAPKHDYDANDRLKIEPKKTMQKRGLRSPDEADALCLTFALPKSVHKNKNQSQSVAQDLMSGSMRLSRIRSGR